jgi:hypothetical protein
MELLEYTVSSGAEARGRNYSFFFWFLGQAGSTCNPNGLIRSEVAGVKKKGIIISLLEGKEFTHYIERK